MDRDINGRIWVYSNQSLIRAKNSLFCSEVRCHFCSWIKLYPCNFVKSPLSLYICMGFPAFFGKVVAYVSASLSRSQRVTPVGYARPISYILEPRFSVSRFIEHYHVRRTYLAMSTDKESSPTIHHADALLKNRFGHSSFRPGQRRVIELLLSSNPSEEIPANQLGRALAIFPTGSGKSLCYQLPALLFPDGLTLVVSPLMALMKDQVEALVRKNIKAACLDSSLSAAETRELYEQIAAKDVAILFVSPERFNNMRFIHAISRTEIALFAVDEAHCISEWGHSFRPDYLRLSRWADRLNIRRRLALTATATPTVARDVCIALDIPFPAGQVRLPNVRPNLTTRLTLFPASPPGLSVDAALEKRVDALAARLRERPPGPTIVYVTLQATSDSVTEMLRSRSFTQAQSYHAGKRQEDRKRVQDEFMANKQDGLVVATIAFGMGMDHESIRYVYHLNIPKSLENYIQEIGRAGRDGLPSVCESFVSVDDIPTLEGFIYGEMPSRRAVRSVVDGLFEVAEPGKDIEYSTSDLCYQYDIRDTCLGQLLAQLDLSEGLLEETTPYFSLIDCGLPPDGQRKWPPAGSLGKRVFDCGLLKRTVLYINVKQVAEETGMDYGQVTRICDDLAQQGVFTKVSSRKLVHRARVKKMPTDLVAIADRLYDLLVLSRDRQIKRLFQVVGFYSTDECLTHVLATHLGDKLDLDGPCGHCEVCLNEKPREFSFAEVVRKRVARGLDERRWALVQLAPIPKDDPYLLARFAAGISSPIIGRKFKRNNAFGSMADHDFNVLLKAAAKECNVDLGNDL